MSDKTAVTIIVPCFNEEPVLPLLAQAMERTETVLRSRYDLHWVFVDDGSTDRTWGVFQRLFSSRNNCSLLRHPRNLGIAAAIMTGIDHAQSDIVCSMDSDCTYDPAEFKAMIPLLAEGVDVVTASPYHPDGIVTDVPHWRLVLSRTASWLYGWVLPQKISTYTSCFRVYRRSAITGLELGQKGFAGITEILGRLMLRGSKVVEYPIMLKSRRLGESKCRVLKAIRGHLRLVSQLVMARNQWQLETRSTRQRRTLPGASHH